MRRFAIAFVALAACAPRADKSPVDPGRDGAAMTGRPDYPPTKTDDVVDELFGHRVADPYRWLENEKDASVQAWMDAQDAFGREHLTALSGREALRRRFEELTYIDSTTPPWRRGERYFFSRTYADKEKEVYFVRRGKDGADEVLIDANALSEDGSISVHGIMPSHTGRYVAYKLSRNNSDASTIYVRDLNTGEDLERDVIDGARYAWASWTPDDRGFYYTRIPLDDSIPADEMPGHAHVRYHVLGRDPAKDEVIVDALGDPTRFIGGGVSQDGHWFMVSHSRGAVNDVYYQDLRGLGKNPKSRTKPKFMPLAVGLQASYGVSVYKDRFYVMSDEDAPNSRVFLVNPEEPEREAWQEIVPETDHALLASYIVGGHLVLNYLRNAHSRMEIRDLDGRLIRTVDLPGLGTTTGMHGRQDEDDAYFYFSSFTEMPQIYETSIATGKTELWDTIDYPVDPTKFQAEQVWYRSDDGTKVSMFVVSAKGTKKDGSHPALLGGYGGFSASMTPWFSPSIVVWIENGGVYAVPNLRGGGEYGEAWHDAGKLARKQNVFDDFVAAAEFLIKEGYTSAERLAISGGSNGGLLVGAAMTQRPELFRAVVCSVPLLDMVRYHLFGTGKLWIPEYGDPEQKEHFEWLLAYSPYHHVEAQKYPALLMLSADSDDRVDPMHARKFLARIQANSTSPRPAILRIERNAGHGGADLRRSAVEESVDTYAFLLDQLGM